MNNDQRNMEVEEKQATAVETSEDTTITPDDKLYFINLLAKAGMLIFGYFLFRIIRNIVLVTDIVDSLETLGAYVPLVDSSLEYDPTVVKSFHGLMRNGIIVCIAGELISALIYWMSRPKR